MSDSFQYKDYCIQLAKAEDYASYETLYEKVYNKKCEKGFYDKKYNHLDASLPTVISYFAIKSGEIIACVSLVPVKMKHANKELVAAQWADGLVSPSHQRLGIGLQLFYACFKKAKTEAIDFLYGLPNEVTFHIFTVKLQHLFISNMQCYTICIKTLPIFSLTNKIKLDKFGKSIATTVFNRYSTKNLETSNSFSSDELAVLRNKTYLHYKQSLGSFYIKINDTFIWIRLKNGALFIGDIVAKREIDIKKTIQKLKQLCFLAGIRKTIFITSKGSDTETFFNQNFHSTSSYKICALALNESVDVTQLKLTYGDADNF